MGGLNENENFESYNDLESQTPRSWLVRITVLVNKSLSPGRVGALGRRVNASVSG